MLVSRDGRYSADKGLGSPLHRKAVAVVAVLTTLILAYLTISRFQHPSPPHAIPALVSVANGKQDGVPFFPQRDISRLSPADHVSRNTTTIQQTWHVTAGLRRPDGVLKRVYLINGDFPGPTLEARSGDELAITVKNELQDEGLAIHFHGLLMRGFNNMDGAVGVTQDPIKPGKSFTYKFALDVNQYGTFWYHAHEGVQRADGLFGGVVIHKPAAPASAGETLAEEVLLLAGDHYHQPAKDALNFYSHPGAFGLETIPDSILLNGAGVFKCADAVPARPLDCLDVDTALSPVLHIDSKKRTILRLVNVGAYTGIRISGRGALFTPLTVDGGHDIVGSASTSIGFIYPGERLDMLVELNPVVAHRKSDLRITLDEQPFKYENPALSASHYFPVQWNGILRHRTIKSRSTPGPFDAQSVKSAQEQTHVLPTEVQETIVLYTLTQKLARLENEPRGFINHTTWSPQTPALIENAREFWDTNQLVPAIQHVESTPKWVDIIVNNLDEDSHPFHLHGHSFWVLAKYSSDYNWGSYNPYEDAAPPGGKYDLERAVQKDTVYVPRRGYAVLRFRADNPGIWAFHCHVLWHEATGMAMAFDVR